MENKVNAFKQIEKHCKKNKKEDTIFYMTYGVYKRTFLDDLRSRGKGRAPIIFSEADFQLYAKTVQYEDNRTYPKIP